MNNTGKDAGLPRLCPKCGADLKIWREMFNERHRHYEQRQGVTPCRRAAISSALIKPQAPKRLELAAIGTVPYASQETGIPEWTIYRMISQGKIRAASKGRGRPPIIKLEPDTITELKRLGAAREARKEIIKRAEEKGKSKEAVRKRLLRYRGLPKDIRDERLRSWLGGG